MDLESFRNSPSGRLVRAGRGEAAYWAFVPHPLPPDMPPDAELMRALSDAAYALGELAALGRTIANPHLLIGPFVRREAVLSSRIEGTQADVADLYAYEAGQPPLPGLAAAPADVREVANYVAALEYGVKRLESLPLSLRLVRELHTRLMRGVRGGQAPRHEMPAPAATLKKRAIEDTEFVVAGQLGGHNLRPHYAPHPLPFAAAAAARAIPHAQTPGWSTEAW